MSPPLRRLACSGGGGAASCAHTLDATSERRGTHVRLKGRRPHSHLSPLPDMLIPAVVAGGHRGDGSEVSESRCVHAAGPCQKSAIRDGLERKQLLFWWDLGREGRDRGGGGIIWRRLLIHSCHLSAMKELKGCFRSLMNTTHTEPLFNKVGDVSSGGEEIKEK